MSLIKRTYDHIHDKIDIISSYNEKNNVLIKNVLTIAKYMSYLTLHSINFINHLVVTNL